MNRKPQSTGYCRSLTHFVPIYMYYMIVINDKNIFVHFSTECFKYILFLTEWNLRAPMIAKIWRDLPEHTREAYKVVNYFNFFPQEFYFFYFDQLRIQYYQ